MVGRAKIAEVKQPIHVSGPARNRVINRQGDGTGPRLHLVL